MKNTLVRKASPTAAPAAVVSVTPSTAQLERLTLVAALLQTTVERLLISETLASLDAESEWLEWFEYSHAQLETYADGKACDSKQRVELLAPARMLALAGYKFQEASN